MPRFSIDAHGKPTNVADRLKINTEGEVFEQMGRYVITEDLKAEVIWERIVGYIFTKSGRPLITKSGRMLCTQKQFTK